MVTMCLCIGSWSRYRATISLTSSPSRGTGKVAYGPTTELHDEKLSVSRYTSWISLYPVTATTRRRGSSSTGHCERSSSKYGYGASTTDSSWKESIVLRTPSPTSANVIGLTLDRSVQSGCVFPGNDVDVLVVGAGITGIYQLYRAREAGFSVQLIEAGSGVGGTWFWNRYPGARFDSESYTYAYLFSKELFCEWEWQEHFAQQPETERYLNHVVDRFDLRRHMRFGATVSEALYDESSGTWAVVTSDGSELRARYLIAATGVLS